MVLSDEECVQEARSIMHEEIEKKVLDTRASEPRRSAISDARRRAPFINSRQSINN